MKKLISFILIFLFFPIYTLAEEEIESSDENLIEILKSDGEVKKASSTSSVEINSNKMVTGDGELKKIDFEEILDTSKPFKVDELEFVNLEDLLNDSTEYDMSIFSGGDDRQKVQDTSVMPYRAISYIITEYEEYYSGCSASLIDDFAVLTNAHCLQDPDTGELAKDVFVFPGMTDNHYSYGSYFMEDFSVPNEFYIGPNNYNIEYDFGVVTLEDYGLTPGQLPIRQVSMMSLSQLLKNYGYPSDKPTVSQWGMTGWLMDQDAYLALYSIFTYFGQSGSPVLNNSNQIVAVHSFRYSAGLGGGPKMVRRVVNFINSSK